MPNMRCFHNANKSEQRNKRDFSRRSPLDIDNLQAELTFCFPETCDHNPQYRFRCVPNTLPHIAKDCDYKVKGKKENGARTPPICIFSRKISSLSSACHLCQNFKAEHLFPNHALLEPPEPFYLPKVLSTEQSHDQTTRISQIQ